MCKPMMTYKQLIAKVHQVLKKTYPYPMIDNNFSKISHIVIVSYDYNWKFPVHFSEAGLILSGEYTNWHITHIFTTRNFSLHEYIALYLTILEPICHPRMIYDNFNGIIHSASMVKELYITSITIKYKTTVLDIPILYTQTPNYVLPTYEIESIPLNIKNHIPGNHFYFPSFGVSGNEKWMKREIDRLFAFRNTYQTIHFHLDNNGGGDIVLPHLILRCLVGSKEKWMKPITKLLQDGDIYSWDCWKEENDGNKEVVDSLKLDAMPIDQAKFTGKIVVYMNKRNGSSAWFFITYLVYAFGKKISRFYKTSYNQKYKYGKISDSDSQLILKGESGTTSGDGNATYIKLNSKMGVWCPTEQFIDSSIRPCDWNMYWTE